MSMTPEEMRVAIAGACRWTLLCDAVSECSDPYEGTHCGDAWLKHGQKWDEMEWWAQRKCYEQQPPNYPTDRDAMADAVAHAVSERGFPFQEAYTRELRRIVTRRRRDLNEMQIDFWMAEADAAQRAEAFCRAFWPERCT